MGKKQGNPAAHDDSAWTELLRNVRLAEFHNRKSTMQNILTMREHSSKTRILHIVNLPLYFFNDGRIEASDLYIYRYTFHQFFYYAYY